MKSIYIKKENIFIGSDEDTCKEGLATLDDVLFYLNCGGELDFSRAYIVQEGMVLFIFDDYLLAFDYILTKE